MRNVEQWQASKFVRHNGSLKASRNPKDVGIRSRMIVDILGDAYWKALQSHASGILLDVGCGNVPLYEAYKDKTRDVICLDWPNTWHKNPYLDLEVDLNEPLPLDDTTADTILASDVLEHLRKPGLFWTEVGRLLKPEGKLILGVPFLYGLHEEPHDYFRYTKHQLRGACEDAGLSVISIDELGGPLVVAMDIIGKSLPWLVEPYQAFACWLNAFRLAKRFNERDLSSFPLAYCLVAQKPAQAMSIL